jgi:acyl-CoA reductase-like NAD-dependent aldehyde dehydrogenase
MSLQSPIKNPDKFFIGGQWVAPSSASAFTVINSATEEVFATVAEAQEADIERAVTAAREAFDHGPWPRLSHAERADYLRALGAEIERMAERSALIWSCESGVVNRAALSVTRTMGDYYRWYADLADRFEFVEHHQSSAEGYVGLIVHEPVGVVAAIIPWNGPPNLSAIKVAPALLAGCSIIVKMSPEAPGMGYLIAEACENIGLPPGVVNVLTADRAVSELLVRHHGVDKVTFTGSTAAGRRIGAICGERIARYTLELGGKSAAIICDDYDVESAAKLIGGRVTFLTGQTCSLLTRVIVPRQRQSALLDAMSAYFATLKVGDPFDRATGMGPLATGRQRDRVEGYVAAGKADGARLVTGGGRPSHLNHGFFFEPTVFGDVDNHSTIAREEIFGPVLSVVPVDSEAEAIAVANDSNYGLGGAVFTNDVDHAYTIARQIRTGTVAHNTHRTEMLIAYGGFKDSGVGRQGGVEGLRSYLEPKTLSLAGEPSVLKAAAGLKAGG